MRVPKRFHLLGHTITVRVVSKRDWEVLAESYEDMEDAIGFWCPSENLILIRRQRKTQVLHTFAHELTHAVLYYMNHGLYKNEVFVDNFGGLLAQALETSE